MQEVFAPPTCLHMFIFTLLLLLIFPPRQLSAVAGDDGGGVSPGQGGDLPPLLHTEPARSVAAAQRRKALVRDTGRTRHKLERGRERERGGKTEGETCLLTYSFLFFSKLWRYGFKE